MIFLGCICGSSESIEFTPTCITYDSNCEDFTNEGINYVEIKNGIFDDLYISSDVSCGEENSKNTPYVWGYDTVLYAPFKNSLNAGNVDFVLSTVSYLLIKRRIVDEFLWRTIHVAKINTKENLNIAGIDYGAKSGVEYEYAAVPVFNNGLEGAYSNAFICTEFNDVFLIGQDRVIATSITDGYCDTTRNIPSSVNILLNSKYPIYIRNTVANYDSGSLSATYIEQDENGCITFDGKDASRSVYQKSVIDFLSDGRPKLLKHPDGRMWLVMVTGNPTDTADGFYKKRKIDFEWTEIGDCESEEDLYYAGLNNIEEEWWS